MLPIELKLINIINIGKLHYYAAIGYAFLLPFDQKIATLAMIFWVVCALANFSKGQLQNNKYLLLLPLLYASYALGIFTSVAPSFTFLEYKLSLLVFPLLFYLHRYTQEQRNMMLRAFVFGLLLSAIVCFVMAVFRSVSIGDQGLAFQANLEAGRGFFESVVYGGNHFFGQQFSVYHQTIYFAMYLCAGIAVVLFNKQQYSKYFHYLLIGIFSLVVFLISNKAGLLVLGCVFLIRILTASYSKKKKVAVLGFLGLFVALLTVTNPRLSQSVQKVVRGEFGIEKEARYDYKTRILSWDAALGLIKEKPLLGYGLGDTQQALNRAYAEKGYKVPLAESFNAHNLFMQLWLENGLPGLLLLMLTFVVLLKKAFQHKEQWGFVLAVFTIFFINGFFESFFSRFSGISFFAFIVCYIFSLTNSRPVKN
ncbi:MAG: O-antigen ligase family protein [Eudoraea sp.]|nr:O-antigen ligase family protein [Eudoraea sp.]